MIYYFRARIGTFEIRPQRSDPSRVELWAEGECYGSYLNAMMAADDVYCHATGFYAWDASQLRAPEDLSGWERSVR